MKRLSKRRWRIATLSVAQLLRFAWTADCRFVLEDTRPLVVEPGESDWSRSVVRQLAAAPDEAREAVGRAVRGRALAAIDEGASVDEALAAAILEVRGVCCERRGLDRFDSAEDEP